MIKKGKLWICDRCSRTEFTEAVEIFGGEIISRKPSDGWTEQYHQKTLCPHCAALYKGRLDMLIKDFYDYRDPLDDVANCQHAGDAKVN